MFMLCLGITKSRPRYYPMFCLITDLSDSTECEFYTIKSDNQFIPVIRGTWLIESPFSSRIHTHSQSWQTFAAHRVQHLKFNSTVKGRQISNNMLLWWAEPERRVWICPCNPSHIIFSTLVPLDRNPGNQWMTAWRPPSNSRQCIRNSVNQELWCRRVPYNLSNGLFMNESWYKCRGAL